MIVGRLQKRLVGDMTLTYPRRVKGSEKIEAWLADEIRDAIALISRQALANRGLTEQNAKLLEELAVAHKKLKALGVEMRSGDESVVRTNQ